MTDYGSKEIVEILVSYYGNLTPCVEMVTVAGAVYSRSVAKDCFNNCFRYIADNPQHAPVYCLGYLMCGGIPIEHAWIKSNNQYIDITLNSNGESQYWLVMEVSTLQLMQYVDSRHHAPDLQSLDRFFRK